MKINDFEIQTRQQLSKDDLAAIRELEGICNEHDSLHMRLNWDMLYERKPGETNDFFCFDRNGQLAGYLALYGFGRAGMETSGMVHPIYRRNGIFSEMVRYASREVCKRGARSLLFFCERISASAFAFVRAYNAAFDHTEYLMEISGNTEPLKVNDSIALRKAGPADFDLLSRLDAKCFGRSEEDGKSFYYGNNLLSSDEMYISVLNGTDIGMVKLCKDKDDVYIYSFGIQPEYRGKGYGRATLGRAVSQALQQNPARVMLEVDCENDTALSLYKSCGFRTVTTYDYYRLPLQPAGVQSPAGR